jgi:hypothetical protein
LRWFQWHRRAIFVNGVMNSGRDHREAAEALSLLLMCPVIGVYNASRGLIADLWESLRDKIRFHGPLASSAESIARRGPRRSAGTGSPAMQAMRAALGENLCTLSLFDVLLEPGLATAEVHAHSQGNIILCNALCGLEALGRRDAVRHRAYHSYGSPVVSRHWPDGITRREYGFSLDYVTVLTRLGPSRSAATLGLPSRRGLPWSHAFQRYLENKVDFVINEHRVGVRGLTLSFDEEGLARHLIELPIPLVEQVFARLHAMYSSDVDDVAVAYVRDLARRRGSLFVRQLRRTAPRLHGMLVRAMAEGWTTAGERECLALLG